MQTYVSYVIQDERGHRHLSEVVNIQSPPYSYSPDQQVQEIVKWADKKKRKLKQGEDLVIVSMYRL